MKKYLNIFFLFSKIGLFTFGGGLAMMPLFRRELVKNKGYITDEELVDIYTISQCTPGAIAVNVSTFIGYKLFGIIGGIIATLGIIFPSIVIILTVACFMQNFMDNEMVVHAFNGVRVCVAALLLNIIYGLFKKSVTNKASFAIFIVSLVLLFKFNISSIFIVIFAAFAGLFSENYKERKKK